MNSMESEDEGLIEREYAYICKWCRIGFTIPSFIRLAEPAYCHKCFRELFGQHNKVVYVDTSKVPDIKNLT
jgi:hypothetical protein